MAGKGNITFSLLSGIKLNAPPPSRYNFAIRLKRNSPSLVVIRTDVRSHKPALPEGGIEGAVGVITHESERTIGLRRLLNASGDQDLAVCQNEKSGGAFAAV